MSLFLDSEFHSSDMYVHLYASAMQFWLLWKWKWKLLSRVWLFATPWAIPHGILQARILESSSLSLLQGIFPTQGSNPGLQHCGRILYQLSHQGSPKILEYPFSSGSSRPRNWAEVSSTAGGFFTNWAAGKHIYNTNSLAALYLTNAGYNQMPPNQSLHLKKCYNKPC